MSRTSLVPVAVLLIGSLQVRAQLSDFSEEEHQMFARKLDKLTAIYRKAEHHEHITPSQISLVRYWLKHQPKIGWGHDFTRIAAMAAGNLRDKQSYETLKKLYLDSTKYQMIRAEAFRAMAKIDPARTAPYVLKELNSDDPVFAIYADIALKEAYGSSFDSIKAKMDKAYRRRSEDGIRY
jgi:HEAT repeat protein